MKHFMDQARKALFVYPLTVIKEDVQQDPGLQDRAHYSSYAWTSVNEIQALIEVIEREQYDLVIFDELQCLGAEKIWKDLPVLRDYLIKKGIKFMGATATPLRTDQRDVVGTFFDNSLVFPYGLHEAIQDGILQKFHYIYGAYDSVMILDELEKKTSIATHYRVNPEEYSNLQLSVINMCNMEETLRTGFMEAYEEVPSYMKMLVFMPNLSSFVREGDEEQENMALATTANVEAWFRDAFPWMTISSMYVTSHPSDNGNLEKMREMSFQENQVDLIFSVDMLNLGYHVSDITGLIMLRGVSSPTLYPQQIGRAFSAGSSREPIIFDLVGNLDRYPIFFTSGQKRESASEVERLWALDESDFFFSSRSVEMDRIMHKLSNYYGDKFEHDLLYLYDKTGCRSLYKLKIALGGPPPQVIERVAAKYGRVLEQPKSRGKKDDEEFDDEELDD
jgi:superfamily II DNA or RNA helicase